MSIESSHGVPLQDCMTAMVACLYGMEVKMNTFTFQSLVTALVATVAAVTLTGLAALPAQAQTHNHDATTPTKLSLDQGRKWTTDGPLRDGMNRIRTLVEPQLAAAHAGKLSPAQFAALASQVETEVGVIVSNCKLEPKADAVLHLVIGEIGAGTAGMAGKTTQLRPAQGLVQVAKAINDYAGHFDHPGFKPIHNVR